MHIALYQPEIPPNTGNVARLCAATNTHLHLIKPLGFSLEDKYLRRAGLDYWPHVNLTVHENWSAFLRAQPGRLVACSARAGDLYHQFAYHPDDCLLLGPETVGLPIQVLQQTQACVRIPITDQVRSLNLSTATGILLYEALRCTETLPARNG
ncbi:MAG: tRNA (cytidine(34)-2'-O)-methyltransferase [Desulfovibrionaceae bacterium]